jgi:hypothetical protein
MTNEQEFDRSAPTRERGDGARSADTLKEAMRRVAEETRREILRVADQAQRQKERNSSN